MKQFEKRLAFFAMTIIICVCAFAQTTLKHVVRRGETFASIASKYGITESKLQADNPYIKTCYTGSELTIIIPEKPKPQLSTSQNNDSHKPNITSTQTSERKKKKGGNFWDNLRNALDKIEDAAYEIGAKAAEMDARKRGFSFPPTTTTKGNTKEYITCWVCKGYRYCGVCKGSGITQLGNYRYPCVTCKGLRWCVECKGRGKNPKISTSTVYPSQSSGNNRGSYTPSNNSTYSGSSTSSINTPSEIKKVRVEKPCTSCNGTGLWWKDPGSGFHSLACNNHCVEDFCSSCQKKHCTKASFHEHCVMCDGTGKREKYNYSDYSPTNNSTFGGSSTSSIYTPTEIKKVKVEKPCTSCNGTGLWWKDPGSGFHSLACNNHCVEDFCSSCQKRHCTKASFHEHCVMCDGTGKREDYKYSDF